MRIIQCRMVTTHVDLHGERFALEALESMRDHIRSSYLPFIYNHDPRCPPLGRVFSAEIVRLEDGEHALDAEVEMFESGPLPALADNRSIAMRTLPTDGFHLTVDRTFSEPEFGESVDAIVRLFKTPPQLEVKKALEPIAVLGITAGVFVVGKFAGAFFSHLGNRAAVALSTRLKDIFRRKRADQTSLLRFEFEFMHEGVNCRADVILTGPNDGEIDAFLAHGLSEVDKMLPLYLNQVEGLVRFVFVYSGGKLKLEFAVRRDAIPVFPTAEQTDTTGDP